MSEEAPKAPEGRRQLGIGSFFKPAPPITQQQRKEQQEAARKKLRKRRKKKRRRVAVRMEVRGRGRVAPARKKVGMMRERRKGKRTVTRA